MKLLSTELTSVRFATVARCLNSAARSLNLKASGFRSPPSRPDVQRSIRRERDGSFTISVQLRGRPGVAVMGDMIDGVVVAAKLEGSKAASLRDKLWSAVATELENVASKERRSAPSDSGTAGSRSSGSKPTPTSRAAAGRIGQRGEPTATSGRDRLRVAA